MRVRSLLAAAALVAVPLTAAPAMAYDCEVAGVNCNVCVRVNEVREALGQRPMGCPR